MESWEQSLGVAAPGRVWGEVGGQTGLLSSRIAAHHPDFQEGEGVFVCGGHSQGFHGQGTQAFAVPTSGRGWGRPILTPSLPGLRGAAGVEIQLREVGGQPGMARKTWASRRILATGQVGSGHTGDHSHQPLWPVGQQG